MKHTPGRNGVSGAVTPAQLYRLGGAASQSWSTPGTNLNNKTYTRVTADYTADGSLFYVTCAHGLHSPHYTWSVVKTDNNAGVIVEYYHQGDDTLTLWFTDNSLALAITVIG